MCAYTNHDEPFRFLDTVGVGLRVTEFGDVDVFGLFDFVCGTVADENGFAAPLNDYLNYNKRY